MALMMAITPENLRAEMNRHRLNRKAVCELIGMHVNALSMFVNGVRPIPSWAAHNIAWAINTATGLMIFDVDMNIGPVEPPRGRPTVAKILTPRKKNRKRGGKPYVKLADQPPSRYQLTGRLEDR